MKKANRQTPVTYSPWATGIPNFCPKTDKEPFLKNKIKLMKINKSIEYCRESHQVLQPCH